MVESCI